MKIKLSKLKPNPDNPKKITRKKLEELKKSLKKYERLLSVDPILIDSWENPLILGGNMRYRAMIEMGLTEIDEKYIKSCEHLTDEEKRALIVIDNANYGEFDYEILSSFYDIDELELFGVDVPQFAEIELDENNLTAEGKNSSPVLKITFVDEKQLQSAMKEIKEIINTKYIGAFLSVSSGEL